MKNDLYLAKARKNSGSELKKPKFALQLSHLLVHPWPGYLGRAESCPHDDLTLYITPGFHEDSHHLLKMSSIVLGT